MTPYKATTLKKPPPAPRPRSRDLPNQYQSYGVSARGKLTHAGVHGMARVNRHEAVRPQRKWMAWRVQYLLDNPGDFPMRTEYIPTVRLVIHPVGKPELEQSFDVSDA